MATVNDWLSTVRDYNVIAFGIHLGSDNRYIHLENLLNFFVYDQSVKDVRASRFKLGCINEATIRCAFLHHRNRQVLEGPRT